MPDIQIKNRRIGIETAVASYGGRKVSTQTLLVRATDITNWLDSGVIKVTPSSRETETEEPVEGFGEPPIPQDHVELETFHADGHPVATATTRVINQDEIENLLGFADGRATVPARPRTVSDEELRRRLENFGRS
jgi:hypothetical protein